MEWSDPESAPDLSGVNSAPIRWVIERAVTGGNRLISLAPWSKALVAHMLDGLTPALKADVEAAWPGLEWYSDAGSPHNPPDEGFIDGAFAVSFPRPRP